MTSKIIMKVRKEVKLLVFYPYMWTQTFRQTLKILNIQVHCLYVSHRFHDNSNPEISTLAKSDHS